MTLSSSTNRNNYVGNNSTATYNYSFKIFNKNDLRVLKRDTNNVESTLTVDTDYTVNNAGDVNGGTIVLTAGNLETGYTLTIRRVRDLIQETDIRNQGDFFPEAHEDAFDHQIMIGQQQQDEVDRALKISETYPTVNSSLTPLASHFLAWNESASGIDNISALDGSSTSVTATGSTTSRLLANRFSDIANVLDFGALGDGVTDDTLSIQAALNTGKNVYFPSTGNVYVVTASLSVKPGQLITGSGKYSADTGWFGIYANMVSPIFLLGDGTDPSLRSMNFQNITVRNAVGPVIKSRYSTNWGAFNCSFTSFGSGHNTIDMEQSYRIAFYNCDIGKSDTGWAASLLDNSNVILFSNCTMSGGSLGGVADIGRSYNITFDTCVYEVSKYGIRIGTNPDPSKGGECNGINIRGCSWEQYTVALEIGNFYACNGVDIRGNFFSNTGTGGGLTKDTMMIIGRVSGLSIKGNVFTPHETEYLFDFYEESTGSGSQQTVHEGSIEDNKYTSIGAGIKYSGYYVTSPGTKNRIPKGLYLEYGESDTIQDSMIIGDRINYSTGIIVPTSLTNTGFITTTPDTGAFIEKIELCSVDPASNLDGVLTLGHNTNAIYNLSVPLKRRIVTNAVDNGSGLVQITSNSHGYINGQTVIIASVGGTTEANGTWLISGVTTNTFDLVGTTFVNTYTSGGTANIFTWINTGYGYYADITSILIQKGCVINGYFLIRIVGAAGTGTIQINIKYRK